MFDIAEGENALLCVAGRGSMGDAHPGVEHVLKAATGVFQW